MPYAIAKTPPPPSLPRHRSIRMQVLSGLLQARDPAPCRVPHLRPSPSMASATSAGGSGGGGAPQVLTIGFGALGILYSYLLERGGAQVTAVARSNYDAIESNGGVDIRSAKYGNAPKWRPTRLVRSAEETKGSSFDYVICTSKATPDFVPLSHAIRPFLSADAARLPLVILIQNGIGIEDEVHESLVEERLASGIVSCCAWVGCNLVEGGKAIEHGALEKLDMGLFPSPSTELTSRDGGIGQPSDAARRAFDAFVAIYRAGGGGANPVADIQPARWRKLLWNVGWGGLCVLARQPVAKLIDEASLPFSIGVVRRTMLEVLYIARGCGFAEDALPASAVDDAINVTLDMAPQVIRQRALIAEADAQAAKRGRPQQAQQSGAGSGSGTVAASEGAPRPAQAQRAGSSGSELQMPVPGGEPRSAYHAAEAKKAAREITEGLQTEHRDSTTSGVGISGRALTAAASAPDAPQKALSAEFKPSILLDLEAGRPMELVPIFEAPMERARLCGVETPRLDMIVAALRPSQVAAIEAARARLRAAEEQQQAARAQGAVQAHVEAQQQLQASGAPPAGAAAAQARIAKQTNTPPSPAVPSTPGIYPPLESPRLPLRPSGAPVPERTFSQAFFARE